MAETQTATLGGIPVLTDSEVYQEGDGYERVYVVRGWHPKQPSLMGRLHIRVDRQPGRSYAKAAVWSRPMSDWIVTVRMPVDDFWPDMPGYKRWSNDSALRETRILAQDLLDRLIEQADYIA